MSDPAYRAGYQLVVLGGDCCPGWYVHHKLNVVTPRLLGEFHLVVVTRDSEEAAEWARKRPGVSLHLVPLCRGLYGRTAEPRWAMEVVYCAGGVLIFGDESRWWRVRRYAKEAGVPVRVVPAPAPGERPPVGFEVDAGHGE